MARRSNRVIENEVAFTIVQIAKTMPNGIVTFHRCRREIPLHLPLSAADHAQSQTRPNEAIWEQLIRNIKSHHEQEGNYICEGYLKHIPRVGYQVTDAGKRRRGP